VNIVKYDLVFLLFTRDQWCCGVRNLRNVHFESETSSNTETETRDLTFETETETRDYKICAFCRNFFLNVVITSELNFFQISGIFPTCLGCFLS